MSCSKRSRRDRGIEGAMYNFIILFLFDSFSNSEHVRKELEAYMKCLLEVCVRRFVKNKNDSGEAQC